MRARDRLGHTLTVTDARSVERYDAAIEALLYFSNDVADAWDATVVDEPDFAMGQIGRAYLRCMSSEGPDAADARRILDEVGSGDRLTERERRHLSAARAYAEGDLGSASEQLTWLLVDHPRDVLALFVGHQIDFFCGDSVTLRDRTGRVLQAWDKSHPWYGFVLGMHAFGLEECNLYPLAEAAGMAALDHDPRDVWALHAVAHVHEMQGRFHDGLAFMDERRADWTEGNFFVVHNSWHEALFKLEAGDVAGALANYDRYVHNESSAKIALEMLDAAALLWRLHLMGIDTGGRWDPLADAWAAWLGENWYVFNDVHAVISFVGAGRLDAARKVVEGLRAYDENPPQGPITNVMMTRDVGLPVASAVLAFGEERYDDAVSLLHPIRKHVQRFGGSNAQRDLVARTMLEAAIRAGAPLSQAIISERMALRDTSPYNWRQLARIRAAAGDDAGRQEAEAKAATLAAGPVTR